MTRRICLSHPRVNCWARGPRRRLLVIALLSAGPLLAQPVAAVGITLGGGDAISGRYSGGGLSAEVSASVRAHRRSGVALSVLVAREWFGTSGDQACVVPCPTPIGAVHLTNALVGAEWWGPQRWVVRGSVGAGTWSRGQSDGWHSGSWQGRVDVASPARGIAALMASGRVSALDDLTFWSVGAGLVLRLPPSRTGQGRAAPFPATDR